MPRGKSTKPKTDKKRDVGDPTFDLIRVFEFKDIGSMDDEELLTRIKKLQEMRLVRVTATRKKSALDLILGQINVERARQYLEVLEKGAKG